jgi:hypothetical protein
VRSSLIGYRSGGSSAFVDMHKTNRTSKRYIANHLFTGPLIAAQAKIQRRLFSKAKESQLDNSCYGEKAGRCIAPHMTEQHR